MRKHAAIGLGLSAVLAVGCGGSTGEHPGGPVEAGLELGTGSWRFEAIDDGAELPLIRGAQGGWHVWLSFASTGMATATGLLVIETQVADESRSAKRTQVDVSFDPAGSDGRRKYVGWPEIFPDPGCFVGQLVRVDASFVDEEGTRVSDERYFTVLGGDDPPDGCVE
ncbi:MAG: hypothetical protein KC417_02555 [Myxococcales bacterium]|nr:hypothetical protein [Myxococcales bacterium]